MRRTLVVTFDDDTKEPKQWVAHWLRDRFIRTAYNLVGISEGEAQLFPEPQAPVVPAPAVTQDGQ